ncbi:hypothetical protein AHF37_10523 [Paragonimus kellicotti]|nr:hypothetical protein AHF37_10523 [Paragonimus kellicotti]
MSELYELFRANRQYAGTFNNEYHPRHVIVCGAINLTSVSLFLDAFVNADRGRYDKSIMMVFMAQREPDLRLKALFKRESVHATYLRGDATSPKDLKRAKVSEPVNVYCSVYTCVGLRSCNTKTKFTLCHLVAGQLKSYFFLSLYTNSRLLSFEVTFRMHIVRFPVHRQR